MATVTNVYNKMRKVDENITELEQQVLHYQKRVEELQRLLESKDINGFVKSITDVIEAKTDEEIERFECHLKAENRDALFFAACVDQVLKAVKSNFKCAISNDHIAEIVCKTLECASYKKWQELKVEGFGRNK